MLSRVDSVIGKRSEFKRMQMKFLLVVCLGGEFPSGESGFGRGLGDRKVFEDLKIDQSFKSRWTRKTRSTRFLLFPSN